MPKSTPVRAKEITKHLMSSLIDTGGVAVIPNAYVSDYPWESDVAMVRPSFHWVEYEIKVTKSDFKADFQKKWGGLEKHKWLRGVDTGYSVAKPSQFYFVFPRGLVEDDRVPPHCGIIEYNKEAPGHSKISVIRTAPRLKSPTKLTEKNMFEMLKKVTWRIYRYE